MNFNYKIASLFALFGTFLGTELTGMEAVKQEEAVSPFTVQKEITFSDAIRSIAWSPDNKTVLIGTLSGKVALLNPETGETIKEFQQCDPLPLVIGGGFSFTEGPYSAPINAVGWNASGKTILTSFNNGATQLRNAETGERIGEFNKRMMYIAPPKLSPNEEMVLTSSIDQITIWNAKTGVEISSFPQKGNSFGFTFSPPNTIYAAAWSPDSTCVVIGTANNTVEVWEVATSTLKQSFKGHSGIILAVDWSPDGKTIASGSADGSAHLWDAESGKLNAIQTLSSRSIKFVAYNKSGTVLLTGVDTDLCIRLFNAETKEFMQKLNHKGDITIAAWSPNGNHILTYNGFTLILWSKKSETT